MMVLKIHRQLHRLYKNIQSMSDGQAVITDRDGENLWLRLEIRPNSGCFKGGRFEFTIKMSELYPNVPPEVTCLTPIFHPNISSCELIYGYSDDADVCVSLLDDWTSSNTLEDCVQALLFLIHNPNLDDPLNPLFSPGQYDEQQFHELAQKSLRGEKVDGCLYPWNYHLEEEPGSEELIGQDSRKSEKSVDEENANRCPCPIRETEMKDLENADKSVDGEEVEGWNYHFEDTPSAEGVTGSDISEEGEEFSLEEYKSYIYKKQSFSGEESDYERKVVLAAGVHRGYCLTNKENIKEYNEKEHNSFGRKTSESFYITKVEYSQFTYSCGREETQHFYCEAVDHLPRTQVETLIIDVLQVDQYIVEETSIQQGRNEMCIINVEANKNLQILECVDLSVIQEGNIYKCLFTLLVNMISESIYSTAEDTKLHVFLEAFDFKYKEPVIGMSVGSVCFTRSAEKSFMDKFFCAILPMPKATRLTYATPKLMLQYLKTEMDKGIFIVIGSDWKDLVFIHASLWIQNEMTTKEPLSYTLLHKANFAFLEVLLSQNIIQTLRTGYLAAGVSNLSEAMRYNISFMDTAVHSKSGDKANIVTMVTVLPLLERMSCVEKEPLRQTGE